MSTSTRTVVSIRKALSPDLAFRMAADSFFDMLEALKSTEIVVDFDEVESISRSFAHQYVLRKKRSIKKISEINVPLHVKKMFEIVKQPKTETVFAEIRKIETILA